MYIDISTVTAKNGKKYKRVLLRQSYRENGKVKKKTIANLSSLPEKSINIIKSNVGAKKNNSPLVELNDVHADSGLKFGAGDGHRFGHHVKQLSENIFFA